MILSAGSTIARASSGSRSRIISVESLISANSAVTVLRSPSGMFCGSALASSIATPNDEGGGAGGWRAVSPGLGGVREAVKGEPHPSQNCADERFSVPHAAHRAAMGTPQVSQNLATSRVSFPQLGQRILTPPLGLAAHPLNASSSAFASFKSAVSKPSL